MKAPPEGKDIRALTIYVTVGDLANLQKSAKGCGLELETWAAKVLDRIAGMRGMPAGVINPDYDVTICPHCGAQHAVRT